MPLKRTLNDAERRAWIRLARTESIGPSTFAALIERFRDPRAALDAAPRLARSGGGQLGMPTDAEAAREIEMAAALSGRIIASVEPEFPAGLAAMEPPPPLILVLGNSAVLAREMVAVVGARNASGQGIKFARRMAEDLGTAGLVVASGLARGIDAAAHQGALATGTVAVMGGGADVVYPPENQALYDSIRRDGAIVSELPLGTAPLARHFPRRNRIVSGLSRGVVVVEAAERSGSLITANFALEQGREVFAVPGSPMDPRAKGTNRLIRDGATLTESAEDVLRVLGPILGKRFQEIPESEIALPPEPMSEREEDRVRALVEEKLSPVPVEVDELIRQTGAPASAVLTILLELELAGRIAREAGGRVAWR
jgi:DNA processing protein